MPAIHLMKPVLQSPPRSEDNAFTCDDLLKVVSHRENIVTIYLMAVVAALIVPKFVTGQQTLLILQVAIWTGTGTAFLLLALAMKERHAWWAFVAAFIPLVNFFMVCRLRSKATGILKEHGITISTAFMMNKEIRRMVA